MKLEYHQHACICHCDCRAQQDTECHTSHGRMLEHGAIHVNRLSMICMAANRNFDCHVLVRGAQAAAHVAPSGQRVSYQKPLAVLSKLHPSNEGLQRQCINQETFAVYA